MQISQAEVLTTPNLRLVVLVLSELLLLFIHKSVLVQDSEKQSSPRPRPIHFKLSCAKGVF